MKKALRTDARRNVPSKPASRKKQASSPVLGEGRLRVAIEHVEPQADDGRYPIKRVVGETIIVEADLFADGHDVIQGILRSRHERQEEWLTTPLSPLVNDRWQGEFVVLDLGRYEYTVTAWVDAFKSWRHDLGRWVQAEQQPAQPHKGRRIGRQVLADPDAFEPLLSEHRAQAAA